jgi:hypothetical protein
VRRLLLEYGAGETPQALTTPHLLFILYISKGIKKSRGLENATAKVEKGGLTLQK